ncbi:MAG: hypothetical protein CM15mP104_2520 [Gammaproteobacteria bacterium]|nr:MAG: hypothetical protein CM15mP104_2520 [Gammaproteobacteria bacterium]
MGLDGHPSKKIAKIEKTNRHSVKEYFLRQLNF